MIDRSLIGREAPPEQIEIEKGMIRRFAEALGDSNPIHHDESAARAQGHRSIVAPLTFPITLVDGERTRNAFDLKQRSLFHGEQLFEYLKPIAAGDVITVKSKIADVHERPGSSGPLTILVIDDEGRDALGEMVFTSRRHYVVRR